MNHTALLAQNFCAVSKKHRHADRLVAVGADFGMQGGQKGMELAGNAADDGHELCRRLGIYRSQFVGKSFADYADCNGYVYDQFAPYTDGCGDVTVYEGYAAEKGDARAVFMCDGWAMAFAEIQKA